MAEKKTTPKKKVVKKEAPKKPRATRVSKKKVAQKKAAPKKAPREQKFAVVKIGGGQERVQEGDLINLPRVEGKEGGKFTCKEVLLVVSSKGVKIGTPFVKGSEVSFKILKHGKDKKIEIRKFRAKSRYRRKTGHRQPISELRVERISF
jgi:large subunit ribosomal protein L21